MVIKETHFIITVNLTLIRLLRAMFFTCFNSFKLRRTLHEIGYCGCHFTNEDTEVQKDYVM